MYTLTLIEIGAWQLRHLVPDYAPSPHWVATLPSLQRDAVWKPGQVELLWDSLFRGFPIGSLVVSEILRDQKSRHGKLAGNDDPWPEPEIEKRHLLDGQQRSNALALGFFDPFPMSSTAPTHAVDSILWLDMFPNPEDFRSGSTRHFLFRLTTTAHPWGYSTYDEAGRLHAHEMQESLRILKDECGWKPPADDPFQRPSPVHLWPIRGTVPIPAAWLLLAAIKNRSGSDLWDAVRTRCESSTHLWACKAAQWLSNAPASQLLEIEIGLRRALSASLVALEVPTETIRANSKQESSQATESDSNAQNLSNVEHLFQRLNNGGTPISPEELQYSMIKAYWPGVEDTISRLHRLPMRASRLSILGCRAALSADRPSSDKIPASMSISALRALATDPQRSEKRALVKSYFEIPDAEQNNHSNPAELAHHQTLRTVVPMIDEWLLHQGGDDIGLPPVLRTAIAHQSPEVYLLLMILADRMLADRVDPKMFRLPILGLATALHWFCSDQHCAVQRVYTLLRDVQKLTPEFFSGILLRSTDEQRHSGLLDLVSPVALGAIIVLPEAEKLEDWNWWGGIVETPSSADPEKREHLANSVWPLVERIVWKKELLIFAQRKWLGIRFRTFDTADASSWEDHNRPWDYDHLLPQDTFRDVRNARFLRVCQQWGNTNGNFHILPFEDNRSRSKTPANQTFANSNLDLMLVFPNDLEAFSLTREDVRDGTDAILCFVQAARRRILAIYEDWYSSLDIAFLLGCPKDDPSNHSQQQ